MNYRAIGFYLEMVLRLLAAFLLIPLAISVFHQEYDAIRGLVVTIVILAVASLVIRLVMRGERRERRGIYTRDGFVLVAVCWVCISLVGALPFYFSGAIPAFVDCLFESISGFTTTGATILTEIESMPRGLLFWRSFTHWIGGMGVLVFLLAASNGDHSVNVMRAESTGPMPGKLVPRLRQSSAILYGIYFTLTLVQVILLIAGGMPAYDSVCTAMATAGTGGFHIKNTSMAFYDNAYFEAVTSIFMVLFGVNFNVIYFFVIRNLKAVWRSEEFRWYLAIFAGTSLLIVGDLLYNGTYAGFGTALRHSSFSVASMMTTTGFCTANFDIWPGFSRMALMVVMMIGACSGSTGGGMKVSRIVILLKEARRSVNRIARPREVGVVKLDGKAVDKQVVHLVTNFFALYCVLAVGSILLVAMDNFDFQSTGTAVLACISNTGPGLGMVGPVGNYAQFSVLSKLILSLNMLFGRLEVYPVLLLFSRRTWRRVS